jgi:hypothetical protein
MLKSKNLANNAAADPLQPVDQSNYGFTNNLADENSIDNEFDLLQGLEHQHNLEST